MASVESMKTIAFEIAQQLGKGKIVVMNLCGRGDKDIFTVAEALGRKI